MRHPSNDGAAAVMLMSAAKAAQLNLPVLARVTGYAVSGVDPSIMGIGPVEASLQCLKRAGWTLDDVDLIEANEAFAAQFLAVGKTLGFDPQKVNVNGGAIALGHPIGASGARILVTLLHALQARDQTLGLATLCIGGGQGIAMIVERMKLKKRAGYFRPFLSRLNYSSASSAASSSLSASGAISSSPSAALPSMESSSSSSTGSATRCSTTRFHLPQYG